MDNIQRDFRAKANMGMAERGYRAGRAVASNPVVKAVRGNLSAGGLLAGVGVGLQGLAMDADGERSRFYDDPNVGLWDKVRQGTRDVVTLGTPAATTALGAGVGSIAPGPGTVVGSLGGAVLGGASTYYMNRMLGKSALDEYQAKNAAEVQRAAAQGDPVDMFSGGLRGKLYKNAKHGAIVNDPRVKQTAMPVRIDPNTVQDPVMRQKIADGQVQDRNMNWTKVTDEMSPELRAVKESTFTADTDPFTRRADPAAELMRQQRNSASTADGGNGLGAAIESAFHAQRGKFTDGRSAFANDDTRALFNMNQALQGTGIEANKQANGVTEFSGNNVSGLGGKLYRAADGSITNDWSKTKDYADQIQRNAKDQDRLAELTRGAALTGDKEAVARLTKGDGRLQAIAEQAASERDLRQAAKDGSAKAAQILATMQSNRDALGMKQAEMAQDATLRREDMGLRRAALVGAQEDRDLNRQLRQDALAERVASNRLSAERYQREQALKDVETLDKQLEQYATVDGKLDGERLSRIRGLAANLQKSPGQTDESYRKDVTTLISLAGKLDGGQSWYDKVLSQAGKGGTDLRAWGKNQGWRGGLVTDQGDHFSSRQWNALTDDEKRVAKLLGMKGEM